MPDRNTSTNATTANNIPPLSPRKALAGLVVNITTGRLYLFNTITIIIIVFIASIFLLRHTNSHTHAQTEPQIRLALLPRPFAHSSSQEASSSWCHLVATMQMGLHSIGSPCPTKSTSAHNTRPLLHERYGKRAGARAREWPSQEEGDDD